MNFEELQSSMQFNFHDSRLKSFQVDYAQSKATFEISLDVADSEESESEYRIGTFTVSGLIYCVVEPVHPQYLPLKKGDQWLVDVGQLSELAERPKCLPLLKDEEFALWMFLNDLNSYIYVSGTDCDWVWKE